MRTKDLLCKFEDLFSSRRGSLYRAGEQLSSRDRDTTIDAYQMWLCILVDLSYLDLDRDAAVVGRIVTDLMSRDVLTTINAFSGLYQSCQAGNFIGFKALCHTISPHLYHLLRDDVEGASHGIPECGKRLIQVSTWLSRLTLADIDLEQQCLEEYMYNEATIQSTLPKSIVSAMKRHIDRWMRAWDPTNLRFSHGPGGVAGHGRTTLETKYRDLSADRKIDIVFGDEFVESPFPIKTELARVSQTIFVPKSYKTFRTISMEPSTLMYLQQGIWREIDRCVEDSVYLRSRIGFHDQERNVKLAKEGSIWRNYATIDLSAASDTVSWDLVKQLFRDTRLYRYLIATRSTHTMLPDGRLVKLNKFAPMGSALCFPIETLVFAAACAVVCGRHSVSSRDRSIAGDFSVFGDDIIVPTEVSADLVSVLTQLGFRVNDDKSFTDADCWYRESCGGEFCEGVDVTPLRISRKYSSSFSKEKGSTKTITSGIAGIIDMANMAWQYGFLTLRSWLIQRYQREDQARPLIPIFGENGFLGDHCTNYHTRSRHDRYLHRQTIYGSHFVAKTTNKGNDEVAYRHWLEVRSSNLSDAGVSFESRVGSTAIPRRRDDFISPIRYEHQKVYIDHHSLRKSFSLKHLEPRNWDPRIMLLVREILSV